MDMDGKNAMACEKSAAELAMRRIYPRDALKPQKKHKSKRCHPLMRKSMNC